MKNLLLFRQKIVSMKSLQAVTIKDMLTRPHDVYVL